MSSSVRCLFAPGIHSQLAIGCGTLSVAEGLHRMPYNSVDVHKTMSPEQSSASVERRAHRQRLPVDTRLVGTEHAAACVIRRTGGRLRVCEHGVCSALRDDGVWRRRHRPMRPREQSQGWCTVSQDKECPHTSSLQCWSVSRRTLAGSSHAWRTKQSVRSCRVLEHLGRAQQDRRRRPCSSANELRNVIEQHGMSGERVDLPRAPRACRELVL